MSRIVDWEALATQLGVLKDGGSEICSSSLAKQAIEILVGEETLQSAVDYYLSGKPGSELARFVLWQLHPWSAMKYCYDIYNSKADIETKRTAIELLRVVADRRALEWVSEFLADPDAAIQIWGMGLLDQLLFSDLVEPEAAESLLLGAENHLNFEVRHKAKFVRQYLENRTRE